MNVVLKSGYVRARKDHPGDGSDYFDFAIKREGYNLAELKELGMSDDEIKSILDARERNFNIQKGEMYYCQVGVWDGDMYTFRTIKAIHEILVKYDLYGEED